MSFEATRLRCEHREDVPLTDEEAPRLGWTLVATGRDRRQSGYRILVATARESLREEAADLWDSGRVSSSRTIDVAYAGLPLPRASEVFWTVQVYDEEGTPSAWADPARFRTGLDAWSASWISCDRMHNSGFTVPPGEFLENEGRPGFDIEGLWSEMAPPAYLRRTFSLAEPVSRATLYATARGLVDLELNGERVGDETLAPGWTDYDKRIQYVAHDVTGLLGEGENALGAILGDGWYAGYMGFLKKKAGALYGEETELLCELHVELAGGGSEVIVSDGSWQATSEGPIRHADLMHGEWHDARVDFDGWSEAGFAAEEGWNPVTTKPRDATLLVPEKGQPVRVVEELRPVSVVEREPGVHLFDLGQNMVGRVRLRTEGPAGTRITLRFAEALNEDGSPHRANLLSAKQTDTFVLRGAGTEVFEPRFTSHGFRHVEVSGLTSAADEETISGCVVHSDLPITSSFSCSSELVERIYESVFWTQRGNFVSVPTDCPQRDERLGWAGDGQQFMPTASLNMDVAAFVTKWLQDFRDGQSADGAFPDVAPRIAWMLDGAPGWGDAGVILPALLYRRYGDRRLLARHWPQMERFMEYIQGENPDFLRKARRNADFGDWLSFGEQTPKELIATAFWARDASLMAEMARALQRPRSARRYERLAADIAAAFNQAYVGADAEIEGDTQTAYVLPLAFDLLPEELRARAAERLVANIERHGGSLTTGILGTGLLCPVLTAAGHGDVAHRLVAREELPSWGHMIRQGATTIWENWDGYTAEKGFFTELQNSFNHYALGAVGAWLIESVAGIRSDPERVAYEHVVIEPVPGELDSARASYRSIRGEIVSDWSRDSERFRLAVTVPANVSATVVIPASGETLSEGGEEAASAPGVHSVAREKNGWRLEVGSGEYEFESR